MAQEEWIPEGSESAQEKSHGRGCNHILLGEKPSLRKNSEGGGEREEKGCKLDVTPKSGGKKKTYLNTILPQALFSFTWERGRRALPI